jgi:uncharacterized repeat protein (TIGR03803 family)
MKIAINSMRLTLVALLLAGAGSLAATFTNLHTFSLAQYDSGVGEFTNSDGYYPNGLVYSGGVLYGITAYGGTAGEGAVFRVNPDGSNFTNLFSFPAPVPDPGNPGYTTSEGTTPEVIVVSGNTIYGTANFGGDKIVTPSGPLYGLGTIFKINTDGSDFALLHTFHGSDGQQPGPGLTLYSNTLYGTTSLGGTDDWGTVFEINTTGSGFATLYNFTNDVGVYAGVVLSSNRLYGFTASGGAQGDGMLYSIGSADGSGFSDLFDFSGTNGAAPYATPTIVGNTIFGSTDGGGPAQAGTVFRINTDGNSFTNLYNFTPPNGENTDGAYPDFCGVVFSGGKLYGATTTSGSGRQGTVYQLNPDGSGFTNLYDFSGSVDGAAPYATPVVSGNMLYGTTDSGGTNEEGIVFALTLFPPPVPLLIRSINKGVVLSWADASLSLYSATNLTVAFTKVLGATSPYTNAATGVQKFFQLQGN